MPRQPLLTTRSAAAFQAVNTTRGSGVAPGSRGHRRLVQPATVWLPSIRTDTRAGTARVRARFRRAPVQPRMRSMAVIVPLEIVIFRRSLTSSHSIEHSAQPHAIHDAARHGTAHDATRAVVHHDEHPVRAQDGRFASKQVETPQTVLCVTEHGEPGRPGRVWFRLVPNGENAPPTSLVMGIPKARAIC